VASQPPGQKQIFTLDADTVLFFPMRIIGGLNTYIYEERNKGAHAAAEISRRDEIPAKRMACTPQHS
jgi:hypothetical protein